MAKRKGGKYRKIPRYDSRADIPKRKKFSGKVYTLYQLRETKKSAEGKAERLRAERKGRSARVVSLKLAGSDKTYYAVYKRG